MRPGTRSKVMPSTAVTGPNLLTRPTARIAGPPGSPSGSGALEPIAVAPVAIACVASAVPEFIG